MAYITDEQYYTNGGTNPTGANQGSYQFISLRELVDNFELLYVGEDKLINRVYRHIVLAHTKRAIQELNYNALNMPKVLELTIGSDYQFVLPPDYVNYIRISLNIDGVLYPMIENHQMTYANSYLQDNNYDIVFDLNGNVIETQSVLDQNRLDGLTAQLYAGPGPMSGQLGYSIDDEWYFARTIGSSYKTNPEFMNTNPTFKIDKNSGVIHFSSDLQDKHVVLEYVSDGMESGDWSEVKMHKFAEECVYSYVNKEILRNARNIPMYEKMAANKRYRAEYNNAKLAMSNLKGSRLIQVLRGKNKWQK